MWVAIVSISSCRRRDLPPEIEKGMEVVTDKYVDKGEEVEGGLALQLQFMREK